MRAVIFDVDGVLIDSEGLWEQVIRDLLSGLGINLTPEEYDLMRGARIDKFIDHWYHQYPWEGPSPEALSDEVVRRVVAAIKERGVAKPGAAEAIQFFKQKGLRVGLASSSPCVIINANVEAIKCEGMFDAICSAEHEPFGKPHPGVYLSTAKALGVLPQECLVIEDSIIGVVAAKAAQMTCVCIPDPLTLRDARLGIADYLLPSLNAINEKFWAQAVSANGNHRGGSAHPSDLHALSDAFLNEIRAALNSVDPSPVSQLQAAIMQAPRIFIAGKGRTGLQMQAFAMRLAQMGLCAYVIGETTTPPIEAGDLLVIGSASGSTPSLVGFAERASQVGAQVTLLTAAASGPIADRAACSVRIPAPSKLDSHDDAASMQPMGSLFESALGILLDTLVIQIMRERRLTPGELYARHANLE